MRRPSEVSARLGTSIRSMPAFAVGLAAALALALGFLTVPVLAIFLALQRYYITGLLGGSVKG